MMRNLALEWGGHGIRSNAIMPGPIVGRAHVQLAGVGCTGHGSGHEHDAAARLPQLFERQFGGIERPHQVDVDDGTSAAASCCESRTSACQVHTLAPRVRSRGGRQSPGVAAADRHTRAICCRPRRWPD